MKWIDVYEEKPPVDTYVLIRYHKKEGRYKSSSDRYCVTEAKLTPITVTTHFIDYKGVEHEYTKPLVSGDQWMDYADRLIMDLKADKSRNFVTHWMPLPEEPE
mgnify:CR=1 FL=1